MSAAQDSIRGQLEAAMKAQAEPPEDEVVETVDTQAASEETTETPAQERARDEKGRFAAKTESEPAVATIEQSGKLDTDRGNDPTRVQPSDVEQSLAGKEAAPTSLAPPNGWPAEAKAKWHELSPEIMAAVQKREQDIAKFTSTRDEHASFGKEIYQVVQPYMATIKAEGGTPATAVQSLLNTAYVLRTGTPEQKKQMLMETARQFGVDLGAAAQPGNQPPVPPGIETLQQRIDRLERERHEERAATQQRLQTEIQSELEAFAADPKHPHYQEVKAHMAALLREGVAKDLQDAYDQAVWARPDTRATLEAQRRAEEEQKRRSEAKAKAEAAKRRNVSITGGPGTAAASAAPGGRSIREELEAAHAAQSGAV